MTASNKELTRVFGRIGLLSFGGPAAQIALMHKELVDETKWLSERQFLGALSFCMLLPGPEAMQLATYAGWRIKGLLGGLLAGALFVAPGALVIFGLTLLYANYGEQPFMNALFFGVKACVVVIVLQALLKVSKKALTGREGWLIAALAFVAIFALQIPFPLIILVAAVWGMWRGSQSTPDPAPTLDRSPLGTVAIVLCGAVLWAAPFVMVSHPLLTDLGLFFSKLAVVTFGGAYAVLAYMAQEVVELKGWMTTPEMMDGLGLAETTPGPLILVTEFVAGLAAYKDGGWSLALAAASITLWVTFVPCFIWIFAGAPYIEWITAQPRLRGALQAITAAVVGVIANLSIWFALHVFFETIRTLDAGPLKVLAPVWSTIDLWALGLTSIAALMMLRFGIGLLTTLACMAALGWSVQTLF